MDSKVVGILGGGQLGRMLAQAAALLNIPVVILDPAPHAPAKQVLLPADPALAHAAAPFTDPAAVLALARRVAVLTAEIEHVDADALDAAQRACPQLQIHPAPATLRTIQDKLAQKRHLRARGLPVGAFLDVDGATPAAVQRAADALGLPLVLKARTGAYDGRGNVVLHAPAQIPAALAALGAGARALYAEAWVPFARELAVVVVRAADGAAQAYPVVETVHVDGVCRLVLAPALGVPLATLERARDLALAAVATFDGAGVFGVEMFHTHDDTILINEIAPRPHNSGHYTIEACETSQFENHLRAVLALPLGSPALCVPAAATLNLLAPASADPQRDLAAFAAAALAVPGARVHLYGKAAPTPGRKMGHVSLVAPSAAALRARLRALLAAHPGGAPPALTACAPAAPARGRAHAFPLASVVMGSDSDLPVLRGAARVLGALGVPHEVALVSAHRTPARLAAWARGAEARGVRVVVAGAGGAAHLPGMIAAMTPLPVVGVPVQGAALAGADALCSIVQMPRGVPVATVAINGAQNAGLLAARILGAADPALRARVAAYAAEMEAEVLAKAGRMEEVGWEAYEEERAGGQGEGVEGKAEGAA